MVFHRVFGLYFHMLWLLQQRCSSFWDAVILARQSRPYKGTNHTLFFFFLRPTKPNISPRPQKKKKHFLFFSSFWIAICWRASLFSLLLDSFFLWREFIKVASSLIGVRFFVVLVRLVLRMICSFSWVVSAKLRVCSLKSDYHVICKIYSFCCIFIWKEKQGKENETNVATALYAVKAPQFVRHFFLCQLVLVL